MTLKSFIVFVVVLAFVALFAYVAHQNNQIVDLSLYKTIKVRSGPLILFSFLAGCLFSFVFGLFAGSRRLVRRWRESRVDRKARQLDEAHREGLRLLQEGDLSAAEKRFSSVLAKKPAAALGP